MGGRISMNKNLVYVLLLVLLANVFSAKTDIEKRLHQGRDILGKDRAKGTELINGAITDYKKILKKDRDNYDALCGIAIANFYLEKDQVSKEFYTKAIKHHPDSADPYFMQGVLAMYAPDFPKAETLIEKAITLNAKNVRYWSDYARVLLQQKKQKEALKALLKVTELNPEEIDGYYQLATLYHTLGDLAKAEATYKKALTKDPTHENTLYNLAQMNQSTGKHEEALRYFTKLNSVNPNDWKAHSKIIQELYALKRDDEAKKKITELYALKKKNTIPSLAKANFYTREQFTLADKKVYCFEHFELQGDKAIKLNFTVCDAKTDVTLYKITLGSYDFTNNMALAVKEIKEGQRKYHLDGYYKDRHVTYGFYTDQPPYDAIRKQVVDIIKGNASGLSSSSKTKDGVTVEIAQ